MKSSQEEADVIIPQYVVHAVSEWAKSVTVIRDDPDVFVLLLPYYLIKGLSWTSAARTAVNIGETYRQHSVVIAQLLAVHAISVLIPLHN